MEDKTYNVDKSYPRVAALLRSLRGRLKLYELQYGIMEVGNAKKD